MGGTASKAAKGARKLPTSTTSAKHAAPTWANARPPSDPPAPEYTASTTQGQDAGPSFGHGRMERGQGVEGNDPRGKPIGRAGVNFSGEKDDVVRQDALDPHFAANLTRLGQVSIHDAGHFIPTQSLAQRTLNSRRDEPSQYIDGEAGSGPPRGHLTANLLSELLDEIKGLPAGSSEKVKSELYRSYGMDPAAVERLRKWVNSPSVGAVDVVRIEDGEEKREMKAVWVDGTESSR